MDHPNVTLQELPTLIRIARRGRPHGELVKETGMDGQTLKRAEDSPTEVSLLTIRKLATWTQHAIVVTPELPVSSSNGAGAAEGEPAS